jgi:hypothetical protein
MSAKHSTSYWQSRYEAAIDEMRSKQDLREQMCNATKEGNNPGRAFVNRIPDSGAWVWYGNNQPTLQLSKIDDPFATAIALHQLINTWEENARAVLQKHGHTITGTLAYDRIEFYGEQTELERFSRTSMGIGFLSQLPADHPCAEFTTQEEIDACLVLGCAQELRILMNSIDMPAGTWFFAGLAVAAEAVLRKHGHMEPAEVLARQPLENFGTVEELEARSLLGTWQEFRESYLNLGPIGNLTTLEGTPLPTSLRMA